MSNYFWGGSLDNHKLRWLRWEDLTRAKAVGGMGFKDLRLFNLAMLGKQSWRLVTRLESLGSRVLKGKYFPHGGFLLATKKKNSCHTWRAILAGRTVLQKGFIKRVGTGETINIWEDNWIPSLHRLRPLTKPEECNANKVSELLSEDGNGWNCDLIACCFHPVEAKEIMKIPLDRLHEDFNAWAFEKHGNYSVRSAYRRLCDERMQNEDARRHAAATSIASMTPMWKQVWKLGVPPKIRSF